MAFSFLVFWLNYFSVNKHFEVYNLYELISGTTIIILIEFLGGWFLKQYKSASEQTLHIVKAKSILDRYFLSYLALTEFTSEEKREGYLSNILEMLDKDLKFPAVGNKVDTSFTQEAFSSITSITETIKKMTGKDSEK